MSYTHLPLPCNFTNRSRPATKVIASKRANGRDVGSAGRQVDRGEARSRRRALAVRTSWRPSARWWRVRRAAPRRQELRASAPTTPRRAPHTERHVDRQIPRRLGGRRLEALPMLACSSPERWRLESTPVDSICSTTPPAVRLSVIIRRAALSSPQALSACYALPRPI